MVKIDKESNCGTTIELNNDVVKKTFHLNAISSRYKPKITDLIVKYFTSLSTAGIQLPNLIDYDDDLNFKFSYCGISVAKELSPNPEKYYSENEFVFDSIVEICQTAINHNLYLDPHIRNFTYQNGEVYYVDVFPPYSEDYLDLLISFNPHLKDKLSALFDLFSPHMIAHHFLADFKKTFKNERILLDKLGEKMNNKGLINMKNMSLVDWIIDQEEIAYVKKPLPLF